MGQIDRDKKHDTGSKPMLPRLTCGRLHYPQLIAPETVRQAYSHARNSFTFNHHRVREPFVCRYIRLGDCFAI